MGEQDKEHRLSEPEDEKERMLTEDEDVEGHHRIKPHTDESDDDVEGHHHLKPHHLKP